jgi:8-oxo-dGTP pyrophosphatase MutT (NUDIX family)
MKEIICSGGLILAKNTKRFLLLHRCLGKTAGTWGFVGGKKEPSDKTSLDVLTREISEELGSIPDIKKIIPLELYKSNDEHFVYNTYVILVDSEFIPNLNDEHTSYAWCSYEDWPKPLHQAVKRTFNSRVIKAKLEILLDLFENKTGP